MELVQGLRDPGAGARGALLVHMVGFKAVPNVHVTWSWLYATHPLGDEYVSVAASGTPLRPAIGERVALAKGLLAASAAFVPDATMATAARNTAAIARFTGQS